MKKRKIAESMNNARIHFKESAITSLSQINSCEEHVIKRMDLLLQVESPHGNYDIRIVLPEGEHDREEYV